MPLGTLVKKNEYHDSVALMQLSSKLNALPGVQDTAAIMATDANRELLVEPGLLTPEVESARANDLIVVVKADSEEIVDQALGQVDELLAQEEQPGKKEEEELPGSIQDARQVLPDANLVLISTPGQYAATEAFKALQEGLHVFMFSDNVALEDEIMLKKLAVEKELLMMGPDCGTAIINGYPLGFANWVRKGRIGIVGASGTGTQEVTSLIHQMGGGVSQAIGVGSRDLSEPVGGIMMHLGLAALANEKFTDVIVLISKPPSLSIARKLLEEVERVSKPVIINFLGGDLQEIHKSGAYPAFSLEDAANLAVAHVNGLEAEPVFFSLSADEINTIIQRETAGMQDEQKWIRGLFSGGTFTYEAQLLLRDMAGKIYSNVPLQPDLKIDQREASREHTLLDLGAAEYTVGRPHPMIDFRTRLEAIKREAKDPETAVILLDVVLGFGSHPDPARELVPAIQSAKELADREGHYLSFVASVCGTDQDIQDRDQQVEHLKRAGVVIMESNAQAARIAGLIATRQSVS